MSSESPPLPRKAEPPLIERARRVGWLLLLLSAGALAVARLGPVAGKPWAVGTAIALGLIGMLAIVNVALVRGLYGEIGKARDAAEADAADGDGASTGSA